ncbi:YrzI family small protein [Litchfieldia alkalitelluris]|nr:YrzI family small protein [Litchfieldia alkalitelluris]
MTLNLFFLTISITKRHESIEEIEHYENVNKMYEEMK